MSKLICGKRVKEVLTEPGRQLRLEWRLKGKDGEILVPSPAFLPGRESGQGAMEWFDGWMKTLAKSELSGAPGEMVDRRSL